MSDFLISGVVPDVVISGPCLGHLSGTVEPGYGLTRHVTVSRAKEGSKSGPILVPVLNLGFT